MVLSSFFLLKSQVYDTCGVSQETLFVGHFSQAVVFFCPAGTCCFYTFMRRNVILECRFLISSTPTKFFTLHQLFCERLLRFRTKWNTIYTLHFNSTLS